MQEELIEYLRALVAKLLQDPKTNLREEFESIKKSKFTSIEKEILNERIKFARIWLKNYAPKEKTFHFSDTIPEQAKQLSSVQKEYLLKVVNLLEKDWEDPKDLQQALYDLSKKIGLSAKEAFGAIYIATLGKNYGPQAAWFLLQNSKKAIERFKRVNTKEKK